MVQWYKNTLAITWPHVSGTRAGSAPHGAVAPAAGPGPAWPLPACVAAGAAPAGRVGHSGMLEMAEVVGMGSYGGWNHLLESTLASLWVPS